MRSFSYTGLSHMSYIASYNHNKVVAPASPPSDRTLHWPSSAPFRRDSGSPITLGNSCRTGFERGFGCACCVAEQIRSEICCILRTCPTLSPVLTSAAVCSPESPNSLGRAFSPAGMLLTNRCNVWRLRRAQADRSRPLRLSERQQPDRPAHCARPSRRYSRRRAARQSLYRRARHDRRERSSPHHRRADPH